MESFELTDPRGVNNIFSHFDTGTVYFSVNNVTEVSSNQICYNCFGT